MTTYLTRSSVAGRQLEVTVGEIRNGIERLRPRDPEQAAVFDVVCCRWRR